MLNYFFLSFFITRFSDSKKNEWSFLTRVESGDSFFIDLKTKTEGDKPKVLLLINGRSLKGKISNILLIEADCKRPRLHALKRIGYGGHMASGKMIFKDENPGNWYFPLPKTPSEKIFFFLCKKKP